MKLDGKKVLMVIASNNFRDEEYSEPRKALEDAGVRITVACSSLNTAKGKLGLEVKPDVLISSARKVIMTGSCSWAEGDQRSISTAPWRTNSRRAFTARESSRQPSASPRQSLQMPDC